MNSADKPISETNGEKTEPGKSSWDAVKDATNSVVDLTGTALHAAAYSTFQQPATAVAQLEDRVTPTGNLTNNVQFMDAPTEAKFGTAAWHAEQIGNSVGQLVPFLLARSAVKPGLGKMLGAAESEASLLIAKQAPVGMSLAESASAGFLTGAVFTPGDASPTSNFWASRAENGGKSAIAMTALTATSGALGRFASLEGVNPTFAKVLTNPISSGIISGAPAGFVSAELDSIQSDRKFASWQEIGQNAYSMSMIGGAFGAVSAVGARFSSDANSRSSRSAGLKTAKQSPNQSEPKELNGTLQDVKAAQAPAQAPAHNADQATVAAHNADRVTTAVHEAAQNAAHEPVQLNLPFEPVEQPPTQRDGKLFVAPQAVTEVRATTDAPKEEQISFYFGKELSPAGQKAAALLDALKSENPDEKEIKTGINDMPISLKEAQSLVILMDESHQKASSLYWALYYRGPVASVMTREIWRKESLDTIEKDLPAWYERALLTTDPSNTGENFVGITRKGAPLGITSTAEAQKFLSLWRRSQPLSNYMGWSGTPDSVGLKRLVDWDKSDSIPDDAIKPIADRLGITGETLSSDTDIQKLIAAAPG